MSISFIWGQHQTDANMSGCYFQSHKKSSFFEFKFKQYREWFTTILATKTGANRNEPLKNDVEVFAESFPESLLKLRSLKTLGTWVKAKFRRNYSLFLNTYLGYEIWKIFSDRLPQLYIFYVGAFFCAVRFFAVDPDIVRILILSLRQIAPSVAFHNTWTFREER